MKKPQGQWLQSCIITLTALSFMQIGFDNGLMGGLGMFRIGTRERELLLNSYDSDYRLLQQDIQQTLPNHHISNCGHLRRSDILLQALIIDANF